MNTGGLEYCESTDIIAIDDEEDSHPTLCLNSSPQRFDRAIASLGFVAYSAIEFRISTGLMTLRCGPFNAASAAGGKREVGRRKASS
jgi:hypothetical protein